MKHDAFRGHLDLLLLGALRAGPGHGYAVLNTLRERSSGDLDFTEGAVYPALHRLEDRGLLASEWEPVAGRRRRVYRITDAGLTALDAEQRDWRSLVSAVDRVLQPEPRRRSGAATQALA